MKNLYGLLCFLLTSCPVFAQTWDTTEVGTFGQSQFAVLNAMSVYGGKIYCGGSRNNYNGSCVISVSPDGEKGTFTPAPGTAALLSQDSSFQVSAMETDPSSTYLFAGTVAGGYYPTLYRYDGSNWINFTTSIPWLSADSSHYGRITAIGFFTSSGSNDSVYIAVEPQFTGLGAGFGTQIYRSSIHNQSWMMVDSFIPYSTAIISDFRAFNNQLFFTCKDYGQVWASSTGMNFTAVSDTGFYNGSNNWAFTAMEVHNGELYVGTDNYWDGTQLWKTADGITWTQVDSAGLGFGPDLNPPYDMLSYNGKLYLLMRYGSMPKAVQGSQQMPGSPQPAVFIYDGTSVSVSSDLSITSNLDDDEYWKIREFNGSLFAAGRSNPDSKMIKGYFPPLASFTLSADTTCYLSTITGINTSSGHDSIAWYINSAPSGFTDTASLFFNNNMGPDTVMLVAWNGPATDTAWQVVYVGPYFSIDSFAPAGTQNVCDGTPVTVTAIISTGTPPYNYGWTYQGNGLGLTSSVSFTAVSGPPQVYLNVTDANGCYSNNIAYINAYPSTNITGTVNYSGGTVNSGTVFLIKQGAFSAEYDTVATTSLSSPGTFTFMNAPSGNYIIRAEADTNAYPALVNTYFGDHYLWDSALTALHGCAATDTNNIVMVEVIPVTGPGSISGVVYEGVGFGQKLFQGPGVTPFANVIPGVPVKVGKNPGGNIVASGATDANGKYFFDNLPYDNYRIYTDIPGYPMDSSYLVTLSAGNDSLVDLDYFVDSNSVYIDLTTSVSALQNEPAKYLHSFPNPAKESFTITFVVKESSLVRLEIFDLQGEKISVLLNRRFEKGKYSECISLEAGLKSGTYMIRANINNNNSIIKLVVMN